MTIRQIAKEILDEPPDLDTRKYICSILNKIVPTKQRPFRLERISPQGGRESRYRLVKVKGPIASRKEVLRYAHELIPLLDELIRETKKDRVYICYSHVCEVAFRIKQVVMTVPADVRADGLNPGQCSSDVPAIKPGSSPDPRPMEG